MPKTIYDILQLFRSIILLRIQVQMQHGVLFPGDVRLGGDGEVLEEFLLAAEKRVDGAHQQALAETSRAGEKIVPARGDEPMDLLRLVNVQISVIPQALEVLYSDGEFAQLCLFP